MNDGVILYSHGCPRCQILKKKLDEAGIRYDVFDDVEAMVAKGFKEAPKLEVGGVVYGYVDAIKWINERQ